MTQITPFKQPDPSWTEVQKGNAQAEVMRKLIQSKFPRTYRLLNGIRFQLPARRQADYPNHEYAAYWDGQLLMDGLTASRLKLLGDPTRWKPIAGVSSRNICECELIVQK